VTIKKLQPDGFQRLSNVFVFGKQCPAAKVNLTVRIIRENIPPLPFHFSLLLQTISNIKPYGKNSQEN
jgi:hypothetical protein